MFQLLEIISTKLSRTYKAETRKKNWKIYLIFEIIFVKPLTVRTVGIWKDNSKIEFLETFLITLSLIEQLIGIRGGVRKILTKLRRKFLKVLEEI